MFRLFSAFHCCQLHCIIYLWKYFPLGRCFRDSIKRMIRLHISDFFLIPQIVLYIGQPEKKRNLVSIRTLECRQAKIKPCVKVKRQPKKYVDSFLCVCLKVLLLWRNTMIMASNSYKAKHLIGAGLQFQRLSLLSSWWEALQNPDMVLEKELSSTSGSAGSRKMQSATRPGLSLRNLKA